MQKIFTGYFENGVFYPDAEDFPNGRKLKVVVEIEQEQEENEANKRYKTDWLNEAFAMADECDEKLNPDHFPKRQPPIYAPEFFAKE
jgi:predicted DNA-binding antitoxin AbrB/MazE fold protein